jgi:hypothetical protein
MGNSHCSFRPAHATGHSCMPSPTSKSTVLPPAQIHCYRAGASSLTPMQLHRMDPPSFLYSTWRRRERLPPSFFLSRWPQRHRQSPFIAFPPPRNLSLGETARTSSSASPLTSCPCPIAGLLPTSLELDQSLPPPLSPPPFTVSDVFPLDLLQANGSSAPPTSHRVAGTLGTHR